MLGVFGEDTGGNFGENKYAEKTEKIEAKKEHEISVDKAKELSLLMAHESAEAFQSSLSYVKSTLTPGFVTRYFNTKIHEEEVIAAERKVVDEEESIQKTVAREYRHHLSETEKAERLKRKVEKEKHLREEVRGALNVAKAVEAKGSMEAYKERHRLQLEQVQARIDKENQELREKVEKEALERRTWRVENWSRRAQEAHDEAVKNQAERNAVIKKEYAHSIDQTYEEWADRDFARARLQVEGNTLSDPVGMPGHELGIFGTPLGPGAYRSVVPGMSGHVPGLDDMEIHTSSTGPNTEFETASVDVIDNVAQLARTQALYDALQDTCVGFTEASNRMVHLKESLDRDRRQVQNEHTVMERDQLGPPRRLPLPHEIVSTNARKERMADLQRRQDELQYSINVINEKKAKAEKQILGLAQQLAASREGLKSSETVLSSLGDSLPIVVGRSLSKVPGIEEFGKPHEMLNAIAHKSKVVSFGVMKDEALKVHKQRGEIDTSIWLRKQEDSTAQSDSERVLSKLAEVGQRLKQSQTESMKLNLQDSIGAFIHKKVPLNKTVLKVFGPMPWYKFHSKKLSNNILQYGTGKAMGTVSFEPEDPNAEKDEVLFNGVTLGEGNIGYCVGVVSLPKVSTWSILIPISEQEIFGGGDGDGLRDETDFVSVRIGPTLATMAFVGTFFNKINPETGSVLYDALHVVRGNTVAFRFDFSSSSRSPERHLSVGPGLYEEYHVKDLETVKDPSDTTGRGRERVVSSFVKMLRVEERQGKLRETKLLEELIDAETSTSAIWDSEVVNHTRQRYSRDFFLRILRAEVLLQQKVSLFKAVKNEDGVGGDEDDDEESGAALEVSQFTGKAGKALKEKLDWSKQQYTNRKVATQRHIVDRGNDLIGKRLEVFDDKTGYWRHVLVKDCKTLWVDLGTKAKCLHVLQEFSDTYENIGREFEVDMEKVRYFDSAVQIVDEAAVLKLREEKMQKDRLLEIDEAAEAQIVVLRDAVNRFRDEEVRTVAVSREKALKRFERSALTRAQKLIDSKNSLSALRQMTNTVLLDMRKGTVPVLPGRKPRDQAKELARERLIEDWTNQKRLEIETEFSEQSAEVQRRVDERLEQFRESEVKILADSRVERYNLEWIIKEKADAARAAVKARLKFRPAEFKKAQYQATSCEHLRTKHWGSNYDKGLRCLQCGKEISRIADEESQLLGFGSGCDPQLQEDLTRYRKNEESFRFKSSEELKRVETETMRLVKERREMEEAESYFYDFQDLTAIYKFDRRHAKSIKTAGIFRQGLQWTAEELEAFEALKVNDERKRIEDAGFLKTEINKFDALACVEEPPPTFRANDERHKAENVNLLFLMGRLNNFQRRITALKEERLDMLSEREMFSFVLTALHKECYILDDDICGLEDDLTKTAKLIATFDSMKALWETASRILTKAKRDMKKAEMNHCGVWELVAENKEQLNFLHDESRQLIKAKVLIEANLKDTTELLNFRRIAFEDWREKWIEAEKEATNMLYRTPGLEVSTRYGNCIIRVYRQKDDMVMVTLPWDMVPPAKAWLYAKEISDRERSMQHGERLLMDLEDQNMHSFVNTERARMKRELFLMRKAEDGYKRYYQFLDLGNNEDTKISSAIDAAVTDSFAVVKSKKYIAATVKAVEDKLTKFVDAAKLEIKEYNGPKAQKPEMPKSIDLKLKRKALLAEMKHSLVLKTANYANNSVRAGLLQARNDWVERYSLELLIDSTVDIEIRKIVDESIAEGRVARFASERLSGILFPNPVWMQFGTYHLLSEIWKERKDSLKRRIEVNRGQASKSAAATARPVLDAAQIAARKEARRKRKAEKRRQEKMNSEMAAEDRRCKEFYRWELKENLRERRIMREEDRVAAKLRKEEKALKAAQESAYGAAGVVDVHKASSYEERRQELKDIALERRRQLEDRAHMVVEDKLSEALREVDRLERQRKKYIAEFGMDDDLDGLDGEEQKKKKIIKIPEWMKKVPDVWDDWDAEKQMKYIDFHSNIRMRMKIIEKKAELEARRLAKLERKSTKEWEDLYSVAQQKNMESELEMMNFEEESKEAECALIDLKDNIRKISIFCREKGEEELSARTVLRRNEENARRRDRELKDATDWLELCLKRAKNRDKVKRRVTANCKWVDTDSITGFQQRFLTIELQKRLFRDYFLKVAHWIANRAETVATERRLLRLQETLSVNREALDERMHAMRVVWRSTQRKELMRMRRSLLNKKFFPLHRRRTLSETFGGWLRFFLWNRGHREAFEMKFEVLKRQLDIDRQFKEQLQSNKATRDSKQASKDSFKTTIQRHKDRPVQCKLCLTFYLDGQNNSTSCAFHPNPYGVYCPRTCANPGLSALCSAHKLRRWKCCDQTKPNAAGCSRRYHLPPDSDPVYDKILERVNERDREHTAKIDDRLAKARRENWKGVVYTLGMGQVHAIEDETALDRAAAERFKDLKFV